MGEREKGHEYFVSGNRICSCGAMGTFTNDGPSMGEQYMAHIASLEAQPEPHEHDDEHEFLQIRRIMSAGETNDGEFNGSIEHAMADIRKVLGVSSVLDHPNTCMCQPNDHQPGCPWVAAHPSAGQSDASLRERWEGFPACELIEQPDANYGYANTKNLKLDKPVLSCEDLKKLEELETTNPRLFQWIRECGQAVLILKDSLAESRAAMREECAKLAESWTNADGSNEPTTSAIASEIRSLPADSSALDARDARARLEEAEFWYESINHSAIECPGKTCWQCNRIENLRAQRSAEKGKGQ